MLTLGYALLSSNLNITGTSNFARTTWNIHFENLVPSTNMTLAQGEGAGITQNKTTEVTYTLNFTEPGQYYEFLVDAKNDGTIHGMVNTITSTKKLGSETAVPITTSPSNLPAYLEYSATYSDGTPIAQYHLLESGETETYKVRIAFSTDIDATDLPGSDQTLELTFGVEYVQKDSNATPVSHPFTGTKYTVNIWDQNRETWLAGTNNTKVWVGREITNNITQYQTADEAMAALKLASGNVDRPFYLKHSIVNNVVQDSYVDFVITPEMAGEYDGMVAGTYSLHGAGGSNCVYDSNEWTWDCASSTSYYNDNVDAIKEAFDYENHPSRCYTKTYGTSNGSTASSFYCFVTGLYAYTSEVGFTDTIKDSWRCEVNPDGTSECYYDWY